MVWGFEVSLDPQGLITNAARGTARPPRLNPHALDGRGLTTLINIFADPRLDFSQNRAEHDDILGDAYEYLMRHFATGRTRLLVKDTRS